jgi:hypothetical protein
MSVSYLSNVYRSNPYIAPINLDLFSKIGQIQQNDFDAESSKIQGEIDNYASLDIMKPNVKDYANQKLTNMVNTVNGMGGVNLADPNVSSRLEQGISSIYNDNIILNGIEGTKQARSLISGYDDFKINPKQKGKYSVANETLDMENIKNWVNDGKLDSQYEGASSPTPYVDYKKADLENLKSLPSSQYQTITQGNSALVFDKVNHVYLNAQQVMDVAAGLRTPEERGQVKRDAIYFSKYQAGYTPQQLQERYVQQNTIGMDKDYQSKMNELSTDLLAASTDNNAKKKIQTSINNLKADYQSRVALYTTPEGLKKINDMYEANPDEFMYNVYNNDYTTALGNRFAFSKETRDLVWNQGEMFNQRQKMQMAQMQQNENHFQTNNALDNEKLKIEMADKGIVSHIDPRTGQREYIKIGGSGKGGSKDTFYDINGNLLPEIPQVSSDNSANPDAYRVDENSIKNNIQTSIDSTDKVLSGLVNSLKTLHPELAKQFSENWGLESPQSFLDIVNQYKSYGDPTKFETSDFNGIEGDARVVDMIRQGAIKQADIDAFSKMVKFANDASSNAGGTVKLPPEYQSGYEQLLPLQENIRYNKTILKDREDYIKTQLSPADLKKVTNKDGSLNWDKIGASTLPTQSVPQGIYSTSMALSAQIANDARNGQDATELMNRVRQASSDYFTNKMSLRPEFSKRSFDGRDNEEQQKYYGGDLFGAIASYEQQRNKADVQPDKLLLRGYGRATDGSGGYEVSYDYALPHKQGQPIEYVHKTMKLDDLPPSTKNPILQRLQLDNPNPLQFVDDILTVVPSTSAYLYPTANTDKPFYLNSRIVNLDRNNPNSTSFYLQYGVPLEGVVKPNPENGDDYQWQTIRTGTKASVLADEAMRTIKNYKPSKYASDNNLMWEEVQFYADPNNRDKNFEQYYKNGH